MDNCYKCQLRNCCVPMRIYSEDTVVSCKNYVYDNEFYDNMPEDFEIYTLKLMKTNPYGTSLVVCTEDMSLFEIVKLSPESMGSIMGDNQKIYVKGYMDNSGCLQLLRQIEPKQEW